MKKSGILIALAAVGLSVHADNPLIGGQFTADPTARVFGGKLYLYPSHDIPSPIESLKEWFCMADYHVFSSDNLMDWTDHGVILDQTQVPWADGESYTMWAPDCVEKDGKYYFYFPVQPAGEGRRGFNVGVALSQSPVGPFFPLPRPIEGINGIDPCVLVDDDGSSYIYWSGMGIRGARLADNMVQLASEPALMEGLPDGFKEGPFAFKRDGKYYLTFPWVRGGEGATETLAYCMSDNPMGPWDFKGLIMEEWPDGCWTNHHSLVEYGGEWYLFYHHNDFSPDFDKNRSARADKVRFAPDGSIIQVHPTFRGIGVADARHPVQIDRYSDKSEKGVEVGFLYSDRKFDGWKTTLSGKGSWVRYNDVDFKDKAPQVLKIRARAAKKSTVAVTLADTGDNAGTVEISPTDRWTMFEAPVKEASFTGVHDLRVSLLKGGPVEIDYIGYDALPWREGAFATGNYRNVFAEMGYTREQIDIRLREIADSLFRGSNRVYFEVGDDMGYITDIKNHDVRTEGQSYGMMCAVQLGDKDMFDRIWRWSKTYMQHSDGPMKGYFRWSCNTDGTPNAQGPASDGELYYVTSLIFAANRWGCDTGIDYLSEARHILDQSMMKAGMNHAAPLVDTNEKLITFTPEPFGCTFTDPSYHVPAFYEVWARWAGDGRSDFWKACAARSREYLHSAVHPETGLTPDYSNYDGSLRGSRGMIGDQFRFDSWRVPMNVALDYSWSCADREWQSGYADRILQFLYSQGIDDFVDQYNVDGSQVERVLPAGEHCKLRHSLGLVATSAAATIAASAPVSREFVEALWNARHEPYDDGYFDAYYDGFLRLFAFMHLSGNYRIIQPDISK